MHELMVIEHKGHLVADSREVARLIGKRHDNLVRDIDSYVEILTASNLRADQTPNLGFDSRDYFIPTSYREGTGKKYSMYYLTKKGCDMVANKMTGKKGVLFSAAYIERFYAMEDALKSRQAVRREFPQFTDTISRIHETPAPHHYSNECDLINRIVLGMSAKEYKETHGIPLSEKSIRPYLNPEQIRLVDCLQKADIGLMLAERDYGKRKMMLEWYKQSLTAKRVTA